MSEIGPRNEPANVIVADAGDDKDGDGASWDPPSVSVLIARPNQTLFAYN